MSFWVSFFGGDLNIWGGGEPAPFGSFLCLCWAGSNGSIWTVSILATLCRLLYPVYPLEVNLTISDWVVPSFWMFVPKAAYFLIPKIWSILSLADFIAIWLFSSVGFYNSFESKYRFWKLCATIEWLSLSFLTIILNIYKRYWKIILYDAI